MFQNDLLQTFLGNMAIHYIKIETSRFTFAIFLNDQRGYRESLCLIFTPSSKNQVQKVMSFFFEGV